MKDTCSTDRGHLYVVTAPSGAGKTTLVRSVMNSLPEIGFSVSYTTRPPRSTEQNGRDYHFVTEDVFECMRTENRFLEYALVFDHWYGTSRDQVAGLLDSGRNVILEIDWQGARQVRNNMPESLGVFILPPSVASLEQRLRSRSTDSESVIQRRLSDAREDMSHWNEFDFIIVNDELADAIAALHAIVTDNGRAWSRDNADIQRQADAIIRS
jgi:guanylate kinase